MCGSPAALHRIAGTRRPRRPPQQSVRRLFPSPPERPRVVSAPLRFRFRCRVPPRTCCKGEPLSHRRQRSESTARPLRARDTPGTVHASASAAVAGRSRPSSSASTRSARCASTRLCVTTTTAAPLSRASPVSKLVHARRQCGDRDCRWVRRRATAPDSVTSARARATRCCSPPERTVTLDAARDVEPTRASTCSARAEAGRTRCVGDQPRHHHVFASREIAKQVVELEHETDSAVTQLGERECACAPSTPPFKEHVACVGDDRARRADAAASTCPIRSHR